MATSLPMRWIISMGLGWIAVLSAVTPAFSQNKMSEGQAAVPSAVPASPASGAPSKGNPAQFKLGPSSGQDYQKDNPLLRADMTKTSEFQGKMFETKEFKMKQFSFQGKDQPIVLNQNFVQNSSMATAKNGWQSKDAGSLKQNEDLSKQQSDFADKRAKISGSVPLKLATGFDGKATEAKKAPGFGRMLSDGQKKYLGPESLQSESEMELIQEHLKKMNTPEELKKNQLTTDEVKKLLQPQSTMTRPK